MKITIDIPKEFERHFKEDKFRDSLLRLKTDTQDGLEHDNTISGMYEIELLDMLVEAFEKAEIKETLQPASSPCPSFFEEDYVEQRW